LALSLALGLHLGLVLSLALGLHLGLVLSLALGLHLGLVLGLALGLHLGLTHLAQLALHLGAVLCLRKPERTALFLGMALTSRRRSRHVGVAIGFKEVASKRIVHVFLLLLYLHI
jgi:hypothetical protein